MTSSNTEHTRGAANKSTHLSYRPDIDGLRALAVLPVILFHAGLSVFSGGYLGVDVFFVISGYLITSIIIKEKQDQTFTLTAFYKRRAKRIFPALLCVLSITALAAWQALPPQELASFAQSIITTLTFSSNILFWMQSGYFDTSTELKPLLHTWSLAVEEQYYIIFPLVIIAFWRLGSASVVAVTALLFIASSAVSFWLTSADQVASFYLLPARAWEILAGALLALVGAKIPTHPQQHWASTLGLALIAAPLFLYDDNTASLPFYAVPTVIGTALVIQFTQKDSLVYRILTLRPMIWVGIISYSAYLWHQPLLAFAKLRFSHDLPASVILLVIAATAALSMATYKLIENPARKTNGLASTLVIFGVTACSAALCAIAYAVHKNEGYPARIEKLYSASAQALEQSLESRFTVDSQESDYYKTVPPPKETILIIGDSYVKKWSVGINENIDHSKYRVISSSYLFCLATVNNGAITALSTDPAYEKNCTEFAEHTNNVELLKTVTKIFLVSHRPFEYAVNTYRFDVLAALQEKTGAPVYIFSNYYQLDPERNFSCMNTMFSTFRRPDVCLEKASWPPEKQVTTSAAVPHNLKYTFVDIIDLLCNYNKSQCPSHSEGVPFLLHDWNHLSTSFTKKIFNDLKNNNKAELEALGLSDIFK